MLFWVDQVCINQRNSEERGHQVGLMSKVYSWAWRTLVWLGKVEAAGGSEQLQHQRRLKGAYSYLWDSRRPHDIYKEPIRALDDEPDERMMENLMVRRSKMPASLSTDPGMALQASISSTGFSTSLSHLPAVAIRATRNLLWILWHASCHLTRASHSPLCRLRPSKTGTTSSTPISHRRGASLMPVATSQGSSQQERSRRPPPRLVITALSSRMLYMIIDYASQPQAASA